MPDNRTLVLIERHYNRELSVAEDILSPRHDTRIIDWPWIYEQLQDKTQNHELMAYLEDEIAALEAFEELPSIERLLPFLRQLLSYARLREEIAILADEINQHELFGGRLDSTSISYLS